jgi:hypothetical protein
VYGVRVRVAQACEDDVKRRLLIIAVCLLAGAVVNVAVASACARWASPQLTGWGNFAQADESWAIDVQSSFGFDVFGLTSRAKVAGGPPAFEERRLPGWAWLAFAIPWRADRYHRSESRSDPAPLWAMAARGLARATPRLVRRLVRTPAPTSRPRMYSQ